jgi:putative sporulation protein YyaC
LGINTIRQGGKYLDVAIKNSEIVYYIDSGRDDAKELFKSALYSVLSEKAKMDYDEIIILCIGSDRATGDCLGPLCGYKLEGFDKIKESICLYGTLDKPVHAKNLSEAIDEIYTIYKKPLVIAVDACLGRVGHVGYITVGGGSLKPGSAMNHSLPSIGDIHITGIVNIMGKLDIHILTNTRLNLVMKLADIISEGIHEFFCTEDLGEINI